MIGPRVFVCDDEMLTWLWSGEHLEVVGYQAECFEDGSSLLAAVRKASGRVRPTSSRSR